MQETINKIEKLGTKITISYPHTRDSLGNKLLPGVKFWIIKCDNPFYETVTPTLTKKIFENIHDHIIKKQN